MIKEGGGGIDKGRGEAELISKEKKKLKIKRREETELIKEDRFLIILCFCSVIYIYFFLLKKNNQTFIKSLLFIDFKFKKIREVLIFLLSLKFEFYFDLNLKINKIYYFKNNKKEKVKII